MALQNRLATVLLVVASFVGCNAESIGGPLPEGEQPSILESHGRGPLIELPARATVGEPFQISVGTFAGGCIQHGGTDVDLRTGAILVRPFDVFPGVGAVCIAIEGVIDHTVSVEVPSEGWYTVQVSGIGVYSDQDGKLRQKPVAFQRTILVLGAN